MTKEFEGGYDITKANRVIYGYPIHLDEPLSKPERRYDPQGMSMYNTDDIFEGVPSHVSVKTVSQKSSGQR